MKPVTLLAVLLIILGVVSFAYQGITYTTQKKVVELGPLEASRSEQKTIPLPPLLGGLALIGGIVILVARKDSI